MKIVWNHETDVASHLIGGKALGLHALKKIEAPVPVWATITSEFLQDVLSRRVEFQPLLKKGNPEDIRQAIGSLTFQKEEERLLQEIWDQISEKGEKSVAVRSSAVDEDGVKLSFAGQMDSFLHVRTFVEFLKTVPLCWASLFSDRAYSYRMRNGLDPKLAKMGVIVQEMVDAEVSGVVFTANPLNHNLDEMLITSVRGLGEGLVSGKLDADTYVLDRTGHIQQEEHVENSLSKDQITALHRLAHQVEMAQGIPVDIEFSIAENQIFLLQARPITSLKKKDRLQIWDNSNIGESYSGVTTPLTFSFIRQAYFAVYWQFCETIGVSQKAIFKNRHIFKNMLGFIQGRVYYNLLNWYELVSLMPGFEYNKGFMEQMMGLQVIKECKSTTASKGFWDKYFVQLPRLLKVSAKMLLAHLRLPKEIAKFHSHFNQVYDHYSKLDYAKMTPSEMLAVYRVLEEEILWEWRSPITNDFEAMIFYGLLKKLTLKWNLDPQGILQNDLLSGEGDIKSTALITDLIFFAQEIEQDQTFKAQFIKSSPEEALLYLRNTPSLNLKFDRYIETYGVRCINEMKLESIPIKDDPLFCIATIQNYLRNGIPAGLEQNLRQSAEEIVQKKLKPMKRSLYRWILRNARKAIKNRENQRFARTQAYSLVRTLIQAIGKQWQEKSILDAARDIFYLELDEIFSFIEGTSTCVHLKDLISLRKQEFKTYGEMNPDDRIETEGEVYFGNLFAEGIPHLKEGIIKGLGCCSGIIEGEVKVVLAPDKSLSLNKEIMVAKQTDPGWAVLFPSVSGLIIEKGSLLSHSAIIAREMGIPAVIGVKNATQIFKNGDRVRLDGAKGIIEKK